MGDIKVSNYECPGNMSLNLQRWWTEATPASENPNRFYLCGGNLPAESGAGVGTNSCSIVDVSTCHVESLSGIMTTSRQALSPVCTPGQCYLFGGNTSISDQATRSVDLLDRTTGIVQDNVFQLPEPRLVYAGAALDDGTFLITGGYGVKDPATGNGPVYNTALRVDPRNGSFVTIQMVHSRGAHSITRLNNGTYLLIGGNGDDSAGAEIYDPNTNTFAPVESKMPGGRKDHRAVLANDGKVYIIGGTMGRDAPTSILVYDPTSQRFSESGLAISQGREDIAVVYIRELDVIVAVGGEIKGAANEPESGAIDVIDLRNHRVISGQLQTPRDEPSVIVRGVDTANQTIELLVLTGQQKRNGTEVSLPAETVSISLK